MTYGSFSWLDRSRESSSTAFEMAALLPDGSNYDDLETALSALKSAMAAVTLGVISDEMLVARKTRNTNVTPADGRRETKWLIRYESSATHDVFSLSLPCADEEAMPFATDSDFVQMTGVVSAARDALVAAIEANIKPPHGGGNAVVLSIECVGRNS